MASGFRSAQAIPLGIASPFIPAMGFRSMLFFMGALLGEAPPPEVIGFRGGSPVYNTPMKRKKRVDDAILLLLS